MRAVTLAYTVTVLLLVVGNVKNSRSATLKRTLVRLKRDANLLRNNGISNDVQKTLSNLRVLSQAYPIGSLVGDDNKRLDASDLESQIISTRPVTRPAYFDINGRNGATTQSAWRGGRYEDSTTIPPRLDQPQASGMGLETGKSVRPLFLEQPPPPKPKPQVKLQIPDASTQTLPQTKTEKSITIDRGRFVVGGKEIPKWMAEEAGLVPQSENNVSDKSTSSKDNKKENGEEALKKVVTDVGDKSPDEEGNPKEKNETNAALGDTEIKTTENEKQTIDNDENDGKRRKIKIMRRITREGKRSGKEADGEGPLNKRKRKKRKNKASRTRPVVQLNMGTLNNGEESDTGHSSHRYTGDRDRGNELPRRRDNPMRGMAKNGYDRPLGKAVPDIIGDDYYDLDSDDENESTYYGAGEDEDDDEYEDYGGEDEGSHLGETRITSFPMSTGMKRIFIDNDDEDEHGGQVIQEVKILPPKGRRSNFRDRPNMRVRSVVGGHQGGGRVFARSGRMLGPQGQVMVRRPPGVREINGKFYGPRGRLLIRKPVKGPAMRLGAGQGRSPSRNTGPLYGATRILPSGAQGLNQNFVDLAAEQQFADALIATDPTLANPVGYGLNHFPQTQASPVGAGLGPLGMGLPDPFGTSLGLSAQPTLGIGSSARQLSPMEQILTQQAGLANVGSTAFGLGGSSTTGLSPTVPFNTQVGYRAGNLGIGRQGDGLGGLNFGGQAGGLGSLGLRRQAGGSEGASLRRLTGVPGLTGQASGLGRLGLGVSSRTIERLRVNSGSANDDDDNDDEYYDVDDDSAEVDSSFEVDFDGATGDPGRPKASDTAPEGNQRALVSERLSPRVLPEDDAGDYNDLPSAMPERNRIKQGKKSIVSRQRTIAQRLQSIEEAQQKAIRAAKANQEAQSLLLVNIQAQAVQRAKEQAEAESRAQMEAMSLAHAHALVEAQARADAEAEAKIQEAELRTSALLASVLGPPNVYSDPYSGGQPDIGQSSFFGTGSSFNQYGAESPSTILAGLNTAASNQYDFGGLGSTYDNQGQSSFGLDQLGSRSLGSTSLISSVPRQYSETEMQLNFLRSLTPTIGESYDNINVGGESLRSGDNIDYFEQESYAAADRDRNRDEKRNEKGRKKISKENNRKISRDELRFQDKVSTLEEDYEDIRKNAQTVRDLIRENEKVGPVKDVTGEGWSSAIDTSKMPKMEIRTSRTG